ncbi:hypothetical protein L465_03638 [Enterobacter sp. BIDMC 29]|uniref:hypothetical protein n=1 Tax=Enterobacter sp. BIDMC 29 TaxID=1329841 RepID=UPI000453AE7E|nr:hypothetical protein [Enterobacter sp. BIDMC 29]EUM08106.1 hypothetical protein L465_03638 [Enterobacter sp. BIDMC 29]
MRSRSRIFTLSIIIFISGHSVPVFAKATEITRATETLQLPLVWSGEIPGTIESLKPAFDNNSVYAIYQSHGRCSSGTTENCVGYSHIKDRQITTLAITLDGFLNYDLPVITGKQGEVYIPVSNWKDMSMKDSLYRLDPLNNAMEIVFKVDYLNNRKEIKNYLLSNDFKNIFVITEGRE